MAAARCASMGSFEFETSTSIQFKEVVNQARVSGIEVQ